MLSASCHVCVWCVCVCVFFSPQKKKTVLADNAERFMSRDGLALLLAAMRRHEQSLVSAHFFLSLFIICFLVTAHFFLVSAHFFFGSVFKNDHEQSLVCLVFMVSVFFLFFFLFFFFFFLLGPVFEDDHEQTLASVHVFFRFLFRHEQLLVFFLEFSKP